MGAEVSMWTDTVELVGRRLTATGEDLGAAWDARRPEILAGEASIGDDIVAGAFGAAYHSDSAQVRAVAAQMPLNLGGDGALALECFQLYAAADDRGRTALADRIVDGG